MNKKLTTPTEDDKRVKFFSIGTVTCRLMGTREVNGKNVTSNLEYTVTVITHSSVAGLVGCKLKISTANLVGCRLKVSTAGLFGC